MGTNEEYLDVVRNLYDYEFKNGVSNQSLSRYFDNAFQSVVVEHDLYPAWACINCLRHDVSTVRWGAKPSKCPVCGVSAAYSVATFQGRASRFGGVFVVALQHLVYTHYGLELMPTPGNTKTHDLEVTPKVAVEVKGSARRITFPDGSSYKISRPGMTRSDTEKKAFDNARNFMRSNPAGTFFIVTNALPRRLDGHRGDNVNGIFDVTKRGRLDSFVDEAKAAS